MPAEAGKTRLVIQTINYADGREAYFPAGDCPEIPGSHITAQWFNELAQKHGGSDDWASVVCVLLPK